MSVGLGRARSVAIAAGGVAAVFGLYWDDAWHTDVGRDAFLSPPHVLLYAGVALLLLVAASWAWTRWRRDGWEALRSPVVLLPLGGAALTLASAPLDELWHQLFGRDAVTWSPPHMVAVAGMFAFAAGLFLWVSRSERTPVVVASLVGAFLIAAAVTPVMEFETDVPQFPVVLYWPVLVGMLVFAFALIRRASSRSWMTTATAGIYVVLRLAVVGFLAVLGHSLPTVMPTVVAAFVFDLLARRGSARLIVAVGTTVAIVASHAVAHALQPAGLTFGVGELLAGGAVGVVAGWIALAAVGEGRPVMRRSSAPIVVSLLVLVVAVGPAAPAFAHDPGQGEDVAPVVLVAHRDGAKIELTVTGVDDQCAEWVGERIVARRAGRTITSDLVSTESCVLAGSVDVDDPGRWFVYAEVLVAGEATESWIPVEHQNHEKATELYAAPVKTAQTFQVVAGVILYVIVIAVMGTVAVVFRRTST